VCVCVKYYVIYTQFMNIIFLLSVSMHGGIKNKSMFRMKK